MAKFSVDTCPVCNQNEFSPFLICRDFFVSGQEFGLKSCNSCGFKITENVEDEEGIEKYYQSEEYVSHSNTSAGIINKVYHFVRKWMLARKRKLVENSNGGIKGKILDVGTGTGFFMNEMKTQGWQVTGTEKNNQAREFSKTEFGIDIYSTEELFLLNQESFDIITLWHVLEHIHRIEDNFTAFHKLLKPEGKLIIAVPNHSSFDAQHYREYWAAYDVPRHIWHFAPNQLKQMGNKYGFTLKGMHPMPFDSFYVSLLSEKYRKSAAALLKGILFGKISWLISLFNKSRCSSLIYVFVKQK